MATTILRSWQSFAVVALLAIAFPLSSMQSAPPTSTAGGVPLLRLEHCLVSVIQDIEVAAQESGTLTSVPAVEGAMVSHGTLLAQVDDRRSQLAKEAADREYAAAAEKARDDIAVRFAIASLAVAEAESAEKEQANLRSPGAVARTELRRLELQVKQKGLEIDKSKLEQRVAYMAALVKHAELKGTDEQIMRRQIVAPIDGEVLAVNRQVGEWVNPGDVVCRVIRMDKLHAEGFLSAADYNPEEIVGQPIVVEVERARGQRVQLPGKITFVSPQVQAGNKYRVRAEIENRQAEKQWLLRPGMTASVTIGGGAIAGRPVNLK